MSNFVYFVYLYIFIYIMNTYLYRLFLQSALRAALTMARTTGRTHGQRTTTTTTTTGRTTEREATRRDGRQDLTISTNIFRLCSDMQTNTQNSNTIFWTTVNDTKYPQHANTLPIKSIFQNFKEHRTCPNFLNFLFWYLELARAIRKYLKLCGGTWSHPQQSEVIWEYSDRIRCLHSGPARHSRSNKPCCQILATKFCF